MMSYNFLVIFYGSQLKFYTKPRTFYSPGLHFFMIKEAVAIATAPFSDFGFQADAAGMIPFGDQRRKILGGVCDVPVRDPADGRTAGKVSRLGVGVQHISGTFRDGPGGFLRTAGNGDNAGVASGGVRDRCGVVRVTPAVAVGIIDDHTGLHIKAVDIKGDRRTAIFHGISFHFHTGAQQVIPFENGSDPVEDMISGPADIVGDFIFIGEHTLHVHIPGPCDQVALVGIFTGKLESDHMAAVVQIMILDEIVIADQMPAAGMDRGDGLPLLRGHQILADAGHRSLAAAERVKVAVPFKGRAVNSGTLLLTMTEGTPL